MLVREGDLRGRRVLEVGCGTGLLAAALAERTAARVWAVDAEPEMVAIARERLPQDAGVRVGSAEELPFRDAWFERAVMRLVIHLVDTERALPELRRVLAPGGRAVVATFDPSHFDGFWLNRLFPSLEAIDRARFPDPAELCRGFEDAGFASTRVVPLAQRREIDRATALERIRGRHISTFDLLEEDEVAAGTARAERELPERVPVRLEWAIVVAEV
ncbi:MAG TPA: methyltransferase domain-containing protein [Gaiellaceae bacterium]|nr:methyltransferase domain-containing protein [Gaiellaceae bacterium]